MSWADEAPVEYTNLGERQRTVRKPRRLSCGGQAERGWRIVQHVYVLDGEFHCDERCQLCEFAAHGFEPIAGEGLHGNVERLQNEVTQRAMAKAIAEEDIDEDGRHSG